MRWLFWVLFIMGLAIGVSLLAGANSGYVLVKTPTYRLETSLNFLIVTISLAFVLLHLALRLFNYTRNLPAIVRAYKDSLRKKAGHQALIQSLHALVEGRYELAEKTATKALDLGEDAGLTALTQALAAGAEVWRMLASRGWIPAAARTLRVLLGGLRFSGLRFSCLRFSGVRFSCLRFS